jgi:hypothetical protein
MSRRSLVRTTAAEILDTQPPGSDVWSDKGFLSKDWQVGWAEQHVRVWPSKRENQHDQNPAEFDRLLNSVREHVEGVRSVEHTLAHTVSGLCARTMVWPGSRLDPRLFLCRLFGIDVLTYTVSA